MVSIAVVGAGRWGKNLLRNFDAAPEGILATICARTEKTCAAAGRQYPKARTTTDFATVVGDPTIQAVVIATDAPQHFAMARAALAAGKHTFVEKPMTLASRDAAELVDLAASKDLKLMVGHILEYHPAVTAMKNLLDAGHFGRPLYLYCQRLNLGVVRSAENAWWGLAPHDISVACRLFDANPVSVTATGQAYLQDDVEDVVFAAVTFDDGQMAHIHVSWLDPTKTRRITLVGDRRMAVFDDMDVEGRLRILDKRAEAAPGRVDLHTGPSAIHPLDNAEPLADECRHFLASIANDTTPLSDGLDGLRVVRVLEAGSESIATGGTPVKL